MKKILKHTTFTILLTTLSLSLYSCFGGSKKESGPDNEMSYEGISFSYPSYWKGQTEDLGDGAYYIECSEKFNGNTLFIVSTISEEREPESLLDGYFGSLESQFDVTKDPMESVKFGEYESISIKYKMSKLREKAYGIAYAFNAGGKTILVIKQSNKEYELKHDKYKHIENSFIVDNATEVDNPEIEKE